MDILDSIVVSVSRNKENRFSKYRFEAVRGQQKSSLTKAPAVSSVLAADDGVNSTQSC